MGFIIIFIHYIVFFVLYCLPSVHISIDSCYYRLSIVVVVVVIIIISIMSINDYYGYYYNEYY